MRVLTVVLILLLILTPAVLANTLDRESEINMTGEVDILSVAASGDTETVVKIQGHGSVVGQEVLSITNTHLEHELAYSLEADDKETVTGNPYRVLELITGIKVAEGQVYVTRVEASGGAQADLYKRMKVELGLIDLTLDKYVLLASGVYERHIDLSADDVSLKEILKIVGSGEAKDNIRFKPTTLND